MDVKASKVVALPLLLIIALGVTGLSYAWWTETLIISSDTVSTGHLRVKFTSMFGEVPLPKYEGACVAEVYTAARKWYPSEGGNPQYLPLTDNTLTMKFRNMFPGASYQVYWLKSKNDGTIPAKIQSITININDPCGIKSYVEWMAPWSTLAWINKGKPGEIRIPNPYPGQWKPIEEVPNWYFNALSGRVLYPEDTLEFDAEEPEEACFYVRLSPNAPDNAEGCSISFDIVFTWTQA